MYALIYCADAPDDPGRHIIAPFDTPEEARESFDVESMDTADGGPWNSANIIEVSKCTSHDDIDWNPGAHVETLTNVSPDDIREAVREDWEWLLDAIESTEEWQDADPTDVGVFDIGDQSAVSVTMHENTVKAEAKDQLIDIAYTKWASIQRKYRRQSNE
jgi:hypothetical protein